jgi:hypothetical protein
MRDQDEGLERLRRAWREADGAAKEAFAREILHEIFGPGDHETLIVAQGLVSSTTGEPMVALTWGNRAAQLTPEEARAHAQQLIEVAAGAEADSFLARFLCDAIELDASAMAAVLVAFRAWRQRRHELPEDPEGVTG